MIKDVEKAIREYLPNIIHMSLASYGREAPWISEVHFTYDENLNFYFRSKTNTRHSKEIVTNPKVAANIVEQHGLEDELRCVSLEGTCQVFTSVKEVKPIAKLFERAGATVEEVVYETNKPNGYKVHKIVVGKFYLFDTRESKPSQKYSLDWN